MPSKSRRRRGKYSAPRGKKKGIISRPPATVQQQTVTQAKKAVPVVHPPTSTIKPAILQHTNVATELRTIAILAGIMLIILIVLAFVPLPW
jgi:hypothetical protein